MTQMEQKNPQDVSGSSQLFGWCMYDWANSAYVTTVVAGVLPIYFASAIVGKGGVQIGDTVVSADALWGYLISASAMFVFLFAPVLGAISDFSSSKKKFLITFAYMGSTSATLLYFSQSGDVWQTVILFLIAQIGYVAANVFYDAFLPQIAPEDKIDWVSQQRVFLRVHRWWVTICHHVGTGRRRRNHSVSVKDSQPASGLGMAGLWWAGFTIFTLKNLKEAGAIEAMPEKYQSQPKIIAYAAIGITRTLATIKKVQRFKHLLLFLIAFMIYNDGVQTVISMATIYGKVELKFSATVLMVTLLMIQIIAARGCITIR